MKKITFFLTVTVFSVFFIFYGCKKKDTVPTATDIELQTDAIQNSTDQSRVDADNESFANDALSKIENSGGYITLGINDTMKKTCDAHIDASLWGTAAKTIVITYRDSACSASIIRSGKITIQLIEGQHWYSAGAVLKFTLSALKIVPALGKGYIYNGERFMTNVSGGLMFGYSASAPVKDTVIHKVRGTASVTFEDGTSRNWWIARKNTYVKNTNVLTVTTNGDTTVNNSICSIGGTTRLSKSFLVQAPEPIVSRSTCGWYKLIGGVRKVITDNQIVTVRFGVNSGGNQQPLTFGCGDYYGYKIE